VGLFGREIVDRDGGAFPRKRDGGRAPDAGVAARDQRLAADEPARADVASLAVVGSRLHVACEAGPRLVLFDEWRLGIGGARVFHGDHSVHPAAASLSESAASKIQ